MALDGCGKIPFLWSCKAVKSLEVRVPHGLSPEEVRRRLDTALVHAQKEYASTVGPIEAEWEEQDRMRVRLAVMGMNFDGRIEILVEEVLVSLELPGMAGLFAARIRDGIQEKLGG